MPLKNFVNRQGPTIDADWLNIVDKLRFTVFDDAATKAEARTALNIQDAATSQAYTDNSITDFAATLGTAALSDAIDFDAAGSAATAEANANAYTDTAESNANTYADNAASTAESNANTYTDNHVNDSSDAHAASAITNTPAGNIVATTVQTAIDELDSEKQASLGFTPEDVANKDTDGTLSANSDTNYPSQKAVVTFVAAQVGAVVSGLVPLGRFSISAGASIPVTSLITSTYDNYLAIIRGLTIGTADVQVLLEVSKDNGATYETTNYLYNVVNDALNASSSISLTNGVGMSTNVTNGKFSGRIWFNNPLSITDPKSISYNILFPRNSDAAAFSVAGEGLWIETGASKFIDAFRLLPGSGTITGVLDFYGIKKPS